MERGGGDVLRTRKYLATQPQDRGHMQPGTAAYVVASRVVDEPPCRIRPKPARSAPYEYSYEVLKWPGKSGSSKLAGWDNHGNALSTKCWKLS